MLSAQVEPLLLLQEGITSITSSCVVPLIPFFIAFCFAFSAEYNSAKKEYPLLFHSALSLLLITGCMVNFAAVAYPFTPLSNFVVFNKPQVGIWAGWAIVAFCVVRVFLATEWLFASAVTLFLALGSSFALTAEWAPCIGEQLGALQRVHEHKGLFLSLYYIGFSIPFLFIGFAFSFLKTGKYIDEHSLRKLYNVIIISALVLVLSGAVRV